MNRAPESGGLRRVLLVNMSMDRVTGGGTAERTRQLARHLVRAGRGCTLVTIAGRGEGGAGAEDLPGVERVVMRPLNRRFHLPLMRPAALLRAVRGADLVHLMNHWTLLNAVVFAVARRMGKPVVVCPAGALRIFGRSRRLKRIYARLVGDRMIRRADGVILVSENERMHFDSRSRPRSVRLIPNGVDPDEFRDSGRNRFRRHFGLPADAPLVLFVGRLSPIKGPDLLVEAFLRTADRLEGWHLVLAGPDEGLAAALSAACRNRPAGDRVHRVGYVGGALKAEAYRAARFLAVPSRQEAMSIVAVEAGAAGTPVLLTDVCGLDDAVRAGGGMAVPATVPALADGLLAMARADLEAMGRAWQDHVLARFGWDAVVARHIDYFDRLVAQRAA